MIVWYTAIGAAVSRTNFFSCVVLLEVSSIRFTRSLTSERLFEIDIIRIPAESVGIHKVSANLASPFGTEGLLNKVIRIPLQNSGILKIS